MALHLAKTVIFTCFWCWGKVSLDRKEKNILFNSQVIKKICHIMKDLEGNYFCCRFYYKVTNIMLLPISNIQNHLPGGGGEVVTVWLLQVKSK